MRVQRPAGLLLTMQYVMVKGCGSRRVKDSWHKPLYQLK